MSNKVLLPVCLVLLALGVGVMIADAQGPKPTAPKRKAPTANAGTAFTYQGQLKNNGALVNGTCDFQFGLWDALSGGTQVGATQNISSLSVTNGLFTTQVDFGANTFTGDARWLAEAVRCPAGGGSYTALSPRQTLTPAPMAFALPGLYTQQNATSPNVIGGYSGNIADPNYFGETIGGGGVSGAINHTSANFATVGGGDNNTASGDHATIDGGWGNTASNVHSTVGGGDSNTASGNGAFVGGGGYDGTSELGNIASGNASTIGGGISNTITIGGDYATIGGGRRNTASSYRAAVGGGESNTASGGNATVGGGYGNTASGNSATVSGGCCNIASGENAFIGGGNANHATGIGATIGGGQLNSAGGWYSTIPGGDTNSTTMTYTLAAGHRAQAVNQGAFVWADSQNSDFASTGNDQFDIRAQGGMGVNTASPVANTLTVGGSGLRVDPYGTTFAKIEAGTTTLGSGISGVNVFTVTLPSAFSSAPHVIVTPRGGTFGGSPVSDIFAASTRSVSTSQFVVNVYRIDNAGGTWSQTLQLDWLAWQ
jgi:hypothetical protein